TAVPRGPGAAATALPGIHCFASTRARNPGYNPHMSDQRPLWPWIITALIGLPVLYFVSFGPACWVCERLEKGTREVSAMYRPVIWAGNRLPLGPDLMSRYARLGARPQSTPDFRDDELAWWESIAGPGSVTPYRSATHCVFGDLDDPSGEEDA